MKPNFHERLAKLRRALDLSLDEFGRQIGFRKSYLSKLERGISGNPSETFLKRTIEKTGVSPAWLLDGVGEIFVSPETPGNLKAKMLAEAPRIPVLINPSAKDLEQAIQEMAIQLPTSKAKRVHLRYIIDLSERLLSCIQEPQDSPMVRAYRAELAKGAEAPISPTQTPSE